MSLIKQFNDQFNLFRRFVNYEVLLKHLLLAVKFYKVKKVAKRISFVLKFFEKYVAHVFALLQHK